MPNSRQKERLPPERCLNVHSHTGESGNQRLQLGLQRKQLGADVLGYHGAK